MLIPHDRNTWQYPAAKALVLSQSTPDDPDTKPKTPRDYDKNVGDRVEKKPRNPESPQQTHENEDHG
jgi:antitoxin (DNA-binding transcriptional repressor) of toxin-antitoxin stability system